MPEFFLRLKEMWFYCIFLLWLWVEMLIIFNF